MKELVLISALSVALLLIIPANVQAEVIVGNIKFTDDGKIVFVDNSEQSTATLQGPQGLQGPKGDPGTPGSVVPKDSICQVYADNNLQPPLFCGGKKTIFFTSETFDGNLGGLAGADEKCQTAASTAGLTGTYKAWLSDSITAVKDRLSHGTVPYVRTDGVVVANNWNDLTDGTLKEQIVCDENRQCYFVDIDNYWIPIWTDSTAAGNRDCNCNDGLDPTPYLTTTCLNWTTNSNVYSGSVGNGTASDSDWTNVFDWSNCNTLRSLICLEQ